MYDWFYTLQVPFSATDRQVKEAWRAAVKATHPDTGGDPEAFDNVQAAYDELKTQSSRDFLFKKIVVSKLGLNPSVEAVEKLKHSRDNVPVGAYGLRREIPQLASPKPYVAPVVDFSAFKPAPSAQVFEVVNPQEVVKSFKDRLRKSYVDGFKNIFSVSSLKHVFSKPDFNAPVPRPGFSARKLAKLNAHWVPVLFTSMLISLLFTAGFASILSPWKVVLTVLLFLPSVYIFRTVSRVSARLQLYRAPDLTVLLWILFISISTVASAVVFPVFLIPFSLYCLYVVKNADVS